MWPGKRLWAQAERQLLFSSHVARFAHQQEPRKLRPEFPTRRDMTVRTGQPRAQTARVDVTAAGNQLSNGAPLRKTYIDALCVLRVRDFFKTGTGEGTSTAVRQMRPGLGTPAPVLHDSWLRSTTVWHSAASPAAPPTGRGALGCIIKPSLGQPCVDWRMLTPGTLASHPGMSILLPEGENLS